MSAAVKYTFTTSSLFGGKQKFTSGPYDASDGLAPAKALCQAYGAGWKFPGLFEFWRWGDRPTQADYARWVYDANGWKA